MNYFIIFVFNFLLFLKVTEQFALGYFDKNHLETYEEISNEQNSTDIFDNLTFYFTCEGMPSGFYADMDYNCKIFHVCDNTGNGFPVICSNNTIFNQKQRICTDEEDIDCLRAHEWYYLNALTHSTEIELKSIIEEIKNENESKVRTDEEIPSVLPLLID